MSTLLKLLQSGRAQAPGDKPAVLARGGSLTYADLWRGAQGIAATLHDAGIGRGHRVGIWMDKTVHCVQAILGTLLAGAAYVPLDPRTPWRRCRAIAQNCGLTALAVDAPRVPVLGQFLEGLSPALVLIDGLTADAAQTALQASPDLHWELLTRAQTAVPRDCPPPRPEDLAYILYTSGSTGTPKGVAHTHASGHAFVDWVLKRFDVSATDVFSSHAPFHFDLSISDLYASLSAGASLRLISSTESMLAPYLVDSIPQWGITVWYSVPSILIAMLDRGNLEARGLPGVRVLLFAGEVCPTPQLRRLQRALPGVQLFNLFGPTETNVCTYYEVPPLADHDHAPISIGRACEHMETFVLDEHGAEAGQDEPGILWVRGGNLMQCYWGDPERTQSTLRDDPRGRPGLAYCTGDFVKLRADGCYDFLGRRDNQIKTRGFRVELGEIESALAAHEGVLEAVAVALPDPEIGHRIVASVVPRTQHQLDPQRLQAFCRELLPLYMVPDRLDVRDELPRTSTGKVDRTLLHTEWQEKATP